MSENLTLAQHLNACYEESHGQRSTGGVIALTAALASDDALLAEARVAFSSLLALENATGKEKLSQRCHLSATWLKSLRAALPKNFA